MSVKRAMGRLRMGCGESLEGRTGRPRARPATGARRSPPPRAPRSARPAGQGR
jgi:hypothetical protein